MLAFVCVFLRYKFQINVFSGWVGEHLFFCTLMHLCHPYLTNSMPAENFIPRIAFLFTVTEEERAREKNKKGIPLFYTTFKVVCMFQLVLELWK